MLHANRVRQNIIMFLWCLQNIVIFILLSIHRYWLLRTIHLNYTDFSIFNSWSISGQINDMYTVSSPHLIDSHNSWRCFVFGIPRVHSVRQKEFLVASSMANPSRAKIWCLIYPIMDQFRYDREQELFKRWPLFVVYISIPSIFIIHPKPLLYGSMFRNK